MALSHQGVAAPLALYARQACLGLGGNGLVLLRHKEDEDISVIDRRKMK